MRVVIQRVTSASVTIDGQVKSSIGLGLLVLLGIEVDDTVEDIEWLCGKISKLRIFSDENGNMNLSIADVNVEFLVPSFLQLVRSRQFHCTKNFSCDLKMKVEEKFTRVNLVPT